MPVIKDLVTDMESTHWTKIRRVTPWLLPEGDPPEREYIVPARVDDRRDPVDGLHPVRRLRLRLPLDGGRPRLHRPRRAGQGLPLRRRPARRPDEGAPPRPRQRPARDLRLHPLLHLHRRLPEGRGADGPDHAAAPDRRRRVRHRRPQQRPPPRARRSPKIIEKKGTLDESLLLQESYAPGRQGQADADARRDQGAARSRSRPRSAASAPARCARCRS